MTLPVSPPASLSFSQVNTELELSSTATITINNTLVRTLAGQTTPASQISFSQLSGKSYIFSLTISSNQTNLNLRTYAIANGWTGTGTLLQVTINGGVYLLANSTGTPALTVSGSFPAGVRLINNGYILGYGGAGGNGGPGSPTAGDAGASGGTGLSISSAISITNNGTVAGGGGGGGGGGGRNAGDWYGGGGGGGGATYGAGGTPGAGSGPGTGRAHAGAAGTLSAGGAGGTADVGGGGGAGGGWGAAGTAGSPSDQRGGGSGGSAGNYVVGNSNVTWVATGTRLGGAS